MKTAERYINLTFNSRTIAEFCFDYNILQISGNLIVNTRLVLVYLGILSTFGDRWNILQISDRKGNTNFTYIVPAYSYTNFNGFILSIG